MLVNAALSEASCVGTNFKLADLRGANLVESDLRAASFEDARVFGAKLGGAVVGNNPRGSVDISRDGDGSETLHVEEWLARVSGPDRSARS